MKTQLLLFLFLIVISNSSFGQLCGTETPVNPIIYSQEDSKEFVSQKGSSSAICINIIFHVVRNTNGTNAFPMPNTNDITADLNEYYSPHNIIFNNLGTDFINNSNFLDLTESEAENLDNINNRNDAINYYIVDNLWNNYAGVVINGLPNRNLFIERDNVNDSTSPHEVGHCLNLYHTHKGLAYNDAGCAEAIDGSNCKSCGDLVCDTPADNGTGAMNGYNPDMTNIMSYYHLNPWLNTLDHFTDDQGFRMRAAIYTEPILQNLRSTSCTQISEINTICYPQTTTVNLSNLGEATTIWTSSSNVQIVSSNNSSATIRGLNSYSNGDGWIRAVLSNGITFQENFHVGKAEVDNVIFRNNGADISGYFCTSHYDNEFEILPYVPNASYEVRIRDLSTNSIVAGPFNFTGNIATLPTSYNYTPGWYLFETRGTNSCGTSSWNQWEVEFVDCSHGGGGESEYIVSPNPSSDILTVKKIKNEPKINTSEYQIKFYDFNAKLIFEDFIRNQISIDVSKFKKGRYILKITKGLESETHHIIIK